MALNNSGPISLGGSTAGQSINLELGKAATASVSLNETAVRSLAGVASGAIIMPTNFYGKSSFSWTLATSGTALDLNGVAYVNSLFVVVGDSGIVLRSSNGTSWSSSTAGSVNLQAVTYGSAKYVAVGTAGSPEVVYTSTDAITWTPRSLAVNVPLYGVAWSGSLFAAVGNAGYIYTSSDGITWTLQSSGTSNILFGAASSGSLFVVVGNSGTILTSPDGVTWTARSSGTTNTLTDVAWVNGVFIAVGSGVLRSTDGISWTTVNTGLSSNGGPAASASKYIAVGAAGTLRTSTDGTTWTGSSSGVTTASLQGIAVSSVRFVAIGYSGTIIYSSST